MPSSPSDRAEQQRIRRLREKMRLAAEFSGAITIPVVWFGHDKRGEFFAIGLDGKRIECTPPTPEPNGTSTAEPVQVVNDHTAPVESKPKRLYPPKAMPRETYEDLVTKIRSQDRSKNSVHMQLDTVAENPEHSGNKAAKQFLALIDALPDGPEWAEHFPTYE